MIIYDGDGNRVAKTVGGVTTRYLVDDRNHTGYAQVLEEIVGGTVQRRYTYGLDLISQNQATGVSYYGYDGHGSVRLLTDVNGSVTDTYTYEAFGNLIHSTGTTPNNYLYSGEQSDANLGFYYLRARYLNAGTGRFWTMDTFGGVASDPSSLHKYLYVNSSPIDQADPSGRTNLVELSTVTFILNVLNIAQVSYFSFFIGVRIGLLAQASYDEQLTFEQAADEAKGIFGEVAEYAATELAFGLGLKLGGAAIRGARTLGLLKAFTVAKYNGRLAEHFIGSRYGLIRNLTYRIGRRLPDFITSSELREIKNVTELSWKRYGSQLGEYAEHVAANAGQKFYIHVRPGTKVLPDVITNLEEIFGAGTRGTKWDIIRNIAEELRVIP